MIDNLPIILSYIVYGYIFLVAYYWISFKDNNDLHNLLIKSVAASYALQSIYKLIEIFIENKFHRVFTSAYAETICFCLLSGVLGFTIGRIISSQKFNNILHKCHIGRTTNVNIWDDVIKPYTWLCVHMNDGTYYLGQYRYGEAFKSEPIIVLETYQWLNEDYQVMVNYSDNPNRKIMLNTKDFDKIEIIYYQKEHSKFDIKAFLAEKQALFKQTNIDKSTSKK